jgi:hypothetical protein
VAENVIAAMKLITSLYIHEWDNVLALFLKTGASPALPIFNALPAIPSTPEPEDDAEDQEGDDNESSGPEDEDE